MDKDRYKELEDELDNLTKRIEHVRKYVFSEDKYDLLYQMYKQHFAILSKLKGK